jgi:phosphoglycerol transferase MdoB-like AlkP superfamily enzyme
MKHYYRNFNRFEISVYHIFITYLFFLALFLMFRVALFFLLTGFDSAGYSGSDLLHALFTGFRFDTQITAVGLLPIILMAFVELLSPPTALLSKIRTALFKAYVPILFVVYLIISIIDIYFYQFFQTHISPIVFGFFQDDTTALIFAIWDDYPVIWILVGLIVSTMGFIALTRWILKLSPSRTIQSKPLKMGTPFIILALLFLGIRGSITGYPLRMDATTITNNDKVNALVCNGVFALRDAISTNNKSKIRIDIPKTLQGSGFATVEELAAFYMGKPCPQATIAGNTIFFDRTPLDSSLEADPPHVVFILAESLSSYYLSLHQRDRFNVLGALEDILPQCIVFNRFLASTPSTIGSLENLMVNTVQFPISQSAYLNTALNTSVAKPFKEAGFETFFATGGDLGWRNMGSFIRLQNFDQVGGAPAVKAHVDYPEKHQYGAYDEYLFSWLNSIITEGSSKPKFIFALSVTNHTPYTVPSHYKPYPLILPDELKENMITDEAFTQRSMLAFQYTNDCLGRFIKKIRSGPQGHKTIIAITGDHNIRKILDFPNDQLLHKQGVPLILYIPEKYNPRKDSINTSCFGSHKDIFPTLFNLALSQGQYVKSGVNLLDPSESESNHAISEFKIFMNHSGCVSTNGKPRYYEWTNAEKTTLKPVETPSEALKRLHKRGQAQISAMNIAVQKAIEQSQSE